jgi:hypothetical protein
VITTSQKSSLTVGILAVRAGRGAG